MIAEPEIRLPLGAVVHDVEGAAWVFVGYALSVCSSSLEFMEGSTLRSTQPRWNYCAVKKETLARKFPDILNVARSCAPVPDLRVENGIQRYDATDKS